VGGSKRANLSAHGRRFPLSLTRTFSAISLKIVFAFAGSALSFSGTATGTLAGTVAGWPAQTAAGHPVTSGHVAAMDEARLSGPFSLYRPGQAGSRAGQAGSHTGRADSGAVHARSRRAGSRAPAAELTAARAVRALPPRQAARLLLRHRFGWKRWQFKYLNRLWARESGWNVYASNPYSGAYGIPQATPGSKMASAGRNWKSSARTQILWGMRYIQARYRTPYWAWLHSRQFGWY
jgi:hypothetical protein